jgi:hypothetical protein
MAHIEAHRVGTGHPPYSIDWRAAFWAGVVGGLAFAALEMAMAPLHGASPWAPLHMIAAIVLGSSAMANPGSFDLTIVLTAVVLHMVLALIYTFILAFVIARMGTGSAVVIGAVYGLLLYGINFYFFTRWFPWFAEHRDWIAIFTHLVQGALWGGLYKAWERRVVVATA